MAINETGSDPLFWSFVGAIYVPIVTSLLSEISGHYIAKKSPHFNSIQDLESLLPEEKKRLKISDYDITLNHTPDITTPNCECLGTKKYRLSFPTEIPLNLGDFRHELRHTKHTDIWFDRSNFIDNLKYLIIREPLAVIYSASALNKNNFNK